MMELPFTTKVLLAFACIVTVVLAVLILITEMVG